MHDMRFRT